MVPSRFDELVGLESLFNSNLQMFSLYSILLNHFNFLLSFNSSFRTMFEDLFGRKCFVQKSNLKTFAGNRMFMTLRK